MFVKYYVYKEGSFTTESKLKARWLAPSDLKFIENGENNFWKFLGEMTYGNRCLGLIDKGEVLAYLWVNDKFIECYGLKQPLKKNEVFIYSAMTKPDRRGNGYAEILRAKCYEILRGQGKDTFYSTTDIKNKSALRLKEKIGAEKIASYLFIKFWRFKYLRHEKF